MLPFGAREMYDLVADIEKYPLFLPWCRAVRVLERSPQGCVAELSVGFRALRERFVSRVQFFPEDYRILTFYEKGPLSDLRCEWSFTPCNNLAVNSKTKSSKTDVSASQKRISSCRVHFFVDFSFRPSLLNAMIDVFFDHAFQKMVAAFEQRAVELYRA